MKRVLALAFVCAAMMSAATIKTGATVLGGTPLTDFEGFAEGTLMLNQVGGVTFGQTPLAGRPQIDNSPFLFGYGQSSGVGVLTGSLEGGYPFPTVAGLTMTFAAPVKAAEVFFSDTAPLGDYGVYAYDSGNNLIESLTVLASEAGGIYVGFQYGSAQLATLVVGPSSFGISPNGGDAFAIDDLRIVRGGQVPEPSTWALMAGGLAALVARRRLSKKS